MLTNNIKHQVTFLNLKAVRITIRKQDVSLEKSARLPTIKHLKLDFHSPSTEPYDPENDAS